MNKKQIQKNILEELGLESLPEEKQKDLLVAMTESVLKRITIAVLEKLSDEEKKEFDRLSNEKDPDAINEFLRSKIENYDGMVEGIVKDFGKEMKETMKGLEKDLN